MGIWAPRLVAKQPSQSRLRVCLPPGARSTANYLDPWRRDPHLIAKWLLQWLGGLDHLTLPRVTQIAFLCPNSPTPNRVDQEFRWLATQQIITRRTGTMREHRGHVAIRVLATGKVFKTQDCPFDAPEKP